MLKRCAAEQSVCHLERAGADNVLEAVNALQKNFPGDRRYYFWTILMSLFVYEDEWEYSKDERQLHGRLALGFIKRSATLVPRPDVSISYLQRFSHSLIDPTTEPRTVP